MKRASVVLVLLAVGLAILGGLAAARLGAMALVGAVGLAIAAAAFIDLRVTLLAVVPAMVLLPELPLAVPVRTEDLLMVPLAGAWLGRLAMGRDTWPSTPLNAPLFILVGAELLATVWGAYQGTVGLGSGLYSASFFLLKTVEVTLLYFIVVTAVRDERDVRVFAYAMCASGAALGVWGIVERGSAAATEAIVGPAGHGGYSLLGLTFVVLLAVVVSLFLTHRTPRTRLLLGLAALPIAYSLIFTFSRQSYVGAAAALLVLLWVRDRRLLIPALALAIVIPLIVPDVVQQRAASIVSGAPDPVTGVTPYSTRVHAILRRLPEVAYRSPVLGMGPGSLPPGFLDNQYLLTVYYTGLIGLGAFLWLLWRTFRVAQTASRELRGRLRGLGLAWLAATVGLALAGLAGSPFVAVRVRQVFWFLAALAVAALLIQRAAADREADADAGATGSEGGGRSAASEVPA